MTKKPKPAPLGAGNPAGDAKSGIAYARALARLAAGTLTRRSVAPLGEAAAERLDRAGLPGRFAVVIPAFWHDQVERRQSKTEAITIAAAAGDLLKVLEHSSNWSEYLRLPDAEIWGRAGAPIVSNDVRNMSLAAYLRTLQDFLTTDEGGALWSIYGRRSIDDRRKSSLQHFVIRYVASITPEASEHDDATPGQRRYGRNAAIATVCKVILARPIDRKTVAQTIKQTV